MRGARLLSVSAERPTRVVANTDLRPELDTSDEWIRTRTGIETRGYAGPGESVVEMATRAGSKALAGAGVDAADIGLLLVATSTMPNPIPGAAPQVAHRLGVPGGALDIGAACAGFSYGVALAADSVRAGSARHALVIGSERLTDWLDWDDRNTAVLFGDAAGAAVIGPAEPADDGIGPVVWGSDGSLSELIRVADHGRYLAMDGRGVFRWAAEAVARISREACAKAGIEPHQLAAFVPHQANLRIIDLAAKQLGLTDDTVVADDVRYSGNTSAASVPLALAGLLAQGRVHRGQPVLLVAFGSGMTWSAQVVSCP